MKEITSSQIYIYKKKKYACIYIGKCEQTIPHTLYLASIKTNTLWMRRRKKTWKGSLA